VVLIKYGWKHMVALRGREIGGRQVEWVETRGSLRCLSL